MRSITSVYVTSLLLAILTDVSASPTVQLDNGTFLGVDTGTTYNFLGIPFAQPPVGDLRFRLPQPNVPYSGVNNATAFGATCPQQAANPSLGLVPKEALLVIEQAQRPTTTPVDEDCLSINVIVPAHLPSNASLPVVAWIYGGGFETGGTSSYNGTVIVDQSIQLGEPVIYVSMNYRVSAFGFLGGQEAKEAGVGNLGLQDQRLALRWIQKYIASFGGDPSKVIIWGESAGAISVAMQMVTNSGNADGLFRGAFMQSGSPFAVPSITDGQVSYDFLVEKTNCTDSADTLECLRSVPFDNLQSAINLTPSFFSNTTLNLTWGPTVDGVFLKDNPPRLVKQGSVAPVPFVTGDCDDEGTLFTLALANITDDIEFAAFVKSNFFPHITDAQLDHIETLYPSNASAGSPFGTGDANEPFPEYKRLAAFQGDWTFQSQRRFFLEERSALQPAFAFLYRRNKDLPVLGSFHTSDLINIYGFGELGAFLIHFAQTLNPNGTPNISTHWPQWDPSTPLMMALNDDAERPLNITSDTFRSEQMRFLAQLALNESD